MSVPSPGASDAAALYRHVFGTHPAVLTSAPGRVNLIGEHTDYNGGLVLPFAIDRRAFVAAGPRPDDAMRICSDRDAGDVVTVPAAGQHPGSVAGWAAYVAGAAWALRQAGHQIGGADIVVSSTVPVGAGLSSSAALECATVLALAEMAGIDIAPATVARLAQRDENDFVGVPCGLMDQMASAAAAAGALLFFDIGADRTEHIPFDLAAAGLAILVMDTRAHHALKDGQYAERRQQCEDSARILGIANLSQLSPPELGDALNRLPDDVHRRRTRHVVTENARVRQVVDLLAARRVADIGTVLVDSHASLRDDFEVSCAELDLAVDTALAHGALGARMTGGGFGGSAIALVESGSADEVADEIGAAFSRAKFLDPVCFPVFPAQGARRESA